MRRRPLGYNITAGKDENKNTHYGVCCYLQMRHLRKNGIAFQFHCLFSLNDILDNDQQMLGTEIVAQ